MGPEGAKHIAAEATGYQRGCDRAPHTMMAPVPKPIPSTSNDAEGPKGACPCATRHKPAPFQRLDKAMCANWTNKGVRIADMKVTGGCGGVGAGLGIGRFFTGGINVSNAKLCNHLCNEHTNRFASYPACRLAGA